MKVKVALLCLITTIGLVGYSQTLTDSLLAVQQQKIITLEKQVVELDSLLQVHQNHISSLQQNVKSLQNDVTLQNRKAIDLQSQITTLTNEVNSKHEYQQQELEGIRREINANTQSIATAASNLNERIDISSDKTDNVAKDLKGNTLWGLVIAMVLLIVSVMVYLLLRKRIKTGATAIDEIEKTQKHLQEESIKLDNKLVELLEGQMKVEENKPTSASSAPDHALALKVADEITRIETNLSRMDASIRGYKQLMASVKRIKDNFMANGYELVEMLGKPYTEGMRVNADFVIDEELEEGKRVITTVTKPQVNYNGEMIQKATITVSQNI